MNRWLILFIGILSCAFLSACRESLRDQLQERQHPYVVNVSPQAGSEFNESQSFEVFFSEAVLPETVTQNSVLFLSQSDFEKYENEHWTDIYKAVQSGKVSSFIKTVNLNKERLKLKVQVNTVGAEAGEYHLMLLPKILSEKYYPLKQNPVHSETDYFQGRFQLKADQKKSQEEQSEDIDNQVSQDQTSFSDEKIPEEHQKNGEEELSDLKQSENPEKTNFDLEKDTSDQSLDQSEDTTQNEENLSEPVVFFDWQRVLLTEVVTDPQQDHSDSEGGDEVSFDEHPGSGTISSSDEYVEIYNGTLDEVDVSEWSLGMFDGTDELQDLNDDKLDLFFSEEGSLEKLGAGEFLIVGNPGGALNNSILIELYDENGGVVDSVDVENANASDWNDEAYYRDENGEWLQGWASPGFFLE